MSNSYERLKAAQDLLVERGVLDVKFCFGTVGAAPSSSVTEDVARFLEAYLEGKFVETDVQGAVLQ